MVMGKLSILKQDLAVGKGFAVSDGYFQDSNRVAAWFIEGNTGTNQIQGACLTPGTLEDQSAFCSELIGIYGILFTLSYLLTESNREVPILVACDGKLALQ